MKFSKVLLVTGIAALALASVAAAATFSNNLTVGSTGADVVALQNALIAAGYSIPAISSGAATPGYFGSQTKSAVMAYQSKNGIPNTGFVGPLTRAALNGGAVVVAPVGCPAGYTCTANPGTVISPVVSGPTGITTPGVPGIITVTQGPLSSVVSNVGTQMAPVLTVRVQAQYSDLSVQSLTLDLGNNTAIFNKVFNKIYVTDGSTVLASQPLNSSTVVQSGNDYVVGLAGFNVIVPKGTYKDIVIKADMNSSIDSKYLSTAAGNLYPGGTASAIFAGTSLASASGAPSSGWGIGLPQNSLRAVDGAGVNLYGPVSGFAQGLTINSSLTDTAQANVSLDPASPQAASIPVSDTTNGNLTGLTALIFDVNAQNDTLHLHEAKVTFNATQSASTGAISAAYLYQGSTLITSASVSNGVADFTNITDGTNGATVPVNQTIPFTVKVDVTGLTSGTLTIKASTATSTTADLTIYNSIDGQATISGGANANTQIVSAKGPLFTIVGTPVMTKTNITAGGATTTVFQYQGTFNVSVTAIGENVNLGLPATTTSAFGTSSAVGANIAQVYVNGAPSNTDFSMVPNFTQPTNTTLSGNGSYFTLSQNQQVTIPVSYSFTVSNLTPSASTYAIQLQGIKWFTSTDGSGNAVASFMANQTAWRTNSI